MNHLEEVNKTYIQHLLYAWKIAFILIVHGIFPNVWKTRASEIINEDK